MNGLCANKLAAMVTGTELPRWKRGEPPRDGRSFVVIGNLTVEGVVEGEIGRVGWSEAVCSCVIWRDASFGMEPDWYFTTLLIPVRQTPKDKLMILFWSEVPA